MTTDFLRAGVVVAYWLVSLGTLGFQYSFGVLYVRMLAALQGSTATTALIGSLCIFFMDGTALLTALIIRRFGPRRCCIIGGLLAAAGWILSSMSTSAWHLLFTYSFLVGSGHSLALFSAIAVVNNTFTKKLAMAHAVANTGGALAPFLMGTAAPALFDAVGWRTTFLVLGGLNGLVIVLAGVLLRIPPKPAVTSPLPAERAADPVPAERASAVPAHSLASRLLRNRRFQLLMVVGLAYGAGAWAGVVHVVRLAMDAGKPEAEAARLLLFISLGSVTARIPVACLADRFGRRRIVSLVMAVLCLNSLVCALDAARASSAFLALFAFVCGGLTGSVNSAAPSLLSELVADHALRQLGASAIFSPMGLGFLLGPVIAAALQQATGTYTSAMGFAATSLALASAVLAYLATLPMEVVAGAPKSGLSPRSSAQLLGEGAGVFARAALAQKSAKSWVKKSASALTNKSVPAPQASPSPSPPPPLGRPPIQKV